MLRFVLRFLSSIRIKILIKLLIKVLPENIIKNLIKDILKSLDTGEPTRGGIRCAYASTELIFAFIESHLGNGIRISVPLEQSQLQLHRSHQPRQPKVT